ncbi:MAG: geranylgeranylglyceryl/heptaprenylglyceryl phosphate synthase [Bacteroidia bacterium]
MTRDNLQDQLDQLCIQSRKALAVLLDPDKVTPEAAGPVVRLLQEWGTDLLLVGGSHTQDNSIHELVRQIKAHSDLPVILFPGSSQQITATADAILLLSLISGRNADLLIGRHVEAAPLLKHSGLQVLPTGYMLIDPGHLTTVQYISNTLPLPHDKPDLAASTALAGQQLGLRLIYLDGGSGAQRPVPPVLIAHVAREIHIPLIVGGGIRSAAAAGAAWQAGAQILVVGTGFEQDPEGSLIRDILSTKHMLNLQAT